MSLFSGMSADKSSDASADALCIIIRTMFLLAGLSFNVFHLAGLLFRSLIFISGYAINAILAMKYANMV